MSETMPTQIQFDEKALQTVRETRLLIDLFDDWLFEEIEPYVGKRILEVGCGLGNLLTHLMERELVVGIDNSAKTVKDVSQKYESNSHILAKTYDISDSSVLDLKTHKFDTAISLNVFEHIENDDLALYHVHELLEPGGRIIIIVPSHNRLFGTMDSSIGHYRRYTKSMMSKKMLSVGFNIENQKYINILGAVGWFVNGKLLKQRVPPTGQLKLFNRIVPLIKAVEQRIPPPFGLSLLTVAYKVK